MNIGGRPRRTLPKDPTHAQKILRDRERRDHWRRLGMTVAVPVYRDLARKAWR